MNYILLKELINNLEEFEEKFPEGAFSDFITFLNRENSVSENILNKNNRSFDSSRSVDIKDYPHVEFSTYIVALYRFAKHYTKKALETTSFKTIDEFGLAAMLFKEKSLLKSELLNGVNIELSTGSEILKRFLKNGIIQEKIDENDRRARRISLTEKGVREILRAFESMYSASIIISGCIENEEIRQSLAVFEKLSQFHKIIHTYDKQSALESIIEKYVPQRFANRENNV